MPSFLARQSRTGRTVSPAVPVPGGETRRFRVLSNTHPADLADPGLWLSLGVEVQQPDASWQFDAGVQFQYGPVTLKDGTVVAAGQERGLTVNGAEYAGKNVRGFVHVRSAAAEPFFGTQGPDATARVGLDFTLLDRV